MVDEKKQVDEIIKILMDVPGAVTYQPEAYRIYTDSPYQHEVAVSSNNGRVTIDYNKLANAVHKYSCIKVREMAKKILQEFWNIQYGQSELDNVCIRLAEKYGVEVE